MNETPEKIPLGPKIKSLQGDTRYPYQEQKDLWGIKQFEAILVFGQGPVKPLLFEKELTEDQKSQWEKFKKDPLHQKEPDFRVIEGKAYLDELKEIQERSDLSDEEKRLLIEEKRREWQSMGRLALNRWGRENALAAGLVLYLGLTDKIILCGGKTHPKWHQIDEQSWPSEAQLMKDIIIRRYDKLYKQRYGKSIEEAIVVEDESTNTLENVANAIIKDPTILLSNKLGGLGSHFHVERIEKILSVFSLSITPRGKISAQDLLREQAEIRGKKSFEEQLKYLINHLENPDVRNRFLEELRWSLGLLNERFLSYWLGYLNKASVPVIHKVLTTLYTDENWRRPAIALFNQVGLNFEEFAKMSLEELQTKEVAERLREGLLKLMKEHREVPPNLKTI